MTKVKRLKEFLQDFLEELDCYDDNDEVRAHPNTYGIDTTYYMQFGYDGFIKLDEVELDTDEEEEWEDDE